MAHVQTRATGAGRMTLRREGVRRESAIAPHVRGGEIPAATVTAQAPDSDRLNRVEYRAEQFLIPPPGRRHGIGGTIFEVSVIDEVADQDLGRGQR